MSFDIPIKRANVLASDAGSSVASSASGEAAMFLCIEKMKAEKAAFWTKRFLTSARLQIHELVSVTSLYRDRDNSRPLVLDIAIFSALQP